MIRIIVCGGYAGGPLFIEYIYIYMYICLRLCGCGLQLGQTCQCEGSVSGWHLGFEGFKVCRGMRSKIPKP